MSNSSPVLALEQAFSDDIATPARRWFSDWGLPDVVDDVRLRFSRRMSRSVGRCYPQRLEVALAAAVKDLEVSRQLEILCHEFAHIAAFVHYGARIRPHGREWQALMRAANFAPKVRFDHEPSLAILRRQAPARPQYLHWCPSCHAQRISVRQMTHWRCGPCYELGRDGIVRITRLDGVSITT